jgi:hypothetical protein
MKKLMICILCVSSIPAFAQFRIGVQGSLSSLNFWQTEGEAGVQTSEFTWALNGFQAGVVGEYDLGYSGLEIQPAIMYATNGSHVGQTLGFTNNAVFHYGYSDTKIKYNDIRIPINLLYGYRIDPKFKVYGGIGVFFQKNLNGTEKGYTTGDSVTNNNYSYTTIPINNTLKLNSNASNAYLGQSNLNPIDIGMDILIGVQYKKLQVSASWNRGFTREYYTSIVNMGNQFWNFTVGYLIFGHDRKPKL